MSHFYASIQGQKGLATRCGSKSSGIVGHIRTWEFGIEVQIQHVNGKDIAYLYKTSGSNGGSDNELLICVTKDGFL